MRLLSVPKASLTPFLSSQTLQCAFYKWSVCACVCVCVLHDELRFEAVEFPKILEQSYDLTRGRSLVMFNGNEFNEKGYGTGA